MICTDIAQRGLDIPDVNHVILFDFPLNPIDYLHRLVKNSCYAILNLSSAGRTGRAGNTGKVTSLIVKRDRVLATAIKNAISREFPLDSLSSSKRDYVVSSNITVLIFA